MSSVVDMEEALSGPLDKAEAVYRANLEMRCFRQEVVRVVLLPSVDKLYKNRLPNRLVSNFAQCFRDLHFFEVSFAGASNP
jgi:hypothetical protein